MMRSCMPPSPPRCRRPWRRRQSIVASVERSSCSPTSSGKRSPGHRPWRRGRSGRPRPSLSRLDLGSGSGRRHLSGGLRVPVARDRREYHDGPRSAPGRSVSSGTLARVVPRGRPAGADIAGSVAARRVHRDPRLTSTGCLRDGFHAARVSMAAASSPGTRDFTICSALTRAAVDLSRHQTITSMRDGSASPPRTSGDRNV
jgi:hypothetical protein